MKLKIRLSLTVFLIVLATILVISILLLQNASSMQRTAASDLITNVTGLASERAASAFDKFFNIGASVVAVFDNYESVDVENRRTEFTEVLKAVAVKYPNIIGIAGIFFPGTLDDQDDIFDPWFDCTSGKVVQKQWCVDTGGVAANLAIPYLQNLSAGSAIAATDQDGKLMRTSVTINGSTDKNQPYVQIWQTVKNRSGAIVGGVGINVSLDPLEDLVSNATALKATYPKTAEEVAFDTNGVCIGHARADMVGQSINGQEILAIMGSKARDDTLETLKDGQPNVGNNIGKFFVSYPFSVGDTGINYTIISSVDESEVFATVNRMRLITVILAVVMVIVTTAIVWITSSQIVKRLISVVRTMKDIAQGDGDLTARLDVKSRDEIGELGGYFNQTMEKIQNLVLTIKAQTSGLANIGDNLASSMDETATAINEITANIDSIKSRAVNQSASVTETSSTMEQITLNIQNLSDNINTQSESISQASSAIEEMLANIQSVTATLVKNGENVKNLASASEVGHQGLQEVASDIQEIAKESEGLMEINAVIDNIASQTNLLSMNAAIEAAHAGEAGKGFAVVADEIRKLAESSSEQSRTISDVLKRITASIEKISGGASSVLSKFEAITEGVKTVDEQEGNIRSAMEEQSEGSRQILEGVAKMRDVTGQVKNSAAEMLEGSQQVLSESRTMQAATEEITNGMNEMATGAGQINTAVSQVNSLSSQNKEDISILVDAVSKFKVD
jgi:methyl-accepting chemotaxis protein